MKQHILPMLQTGQDSILAGRIDGERARHRFRSILSPITAPTLIILEFRSVDLATASYLDEVTLKLRTDLRRAPAYLIAANLSAKVQEEFEHLLRRANDVFVACELSKNGVTSKPRVLGSLEPKLEETYKLVKQKGEASATELYSESSSESGVAENIGPTAWNNRLNALVDKGLLLEIPLGRAKKYRPILEVK